MKMKLTQSTLQSIKPGDKPYWITDEGYANLRLHVAVSGKKIWYVQYRDTNGKHQSHKLGSTDSLTVAQAREMARKIAVRVADGEQVKKEKPAEKLTLGGYLNDIYFPMVRRTLKSAAETIRKITANFSEYFNTSIEELTPITFEKWRTERLESGKKAATVNRCLSTLKAALSWGVKNHLIEENPLRHVSKTPETDSKSIVRYLSPDERERLEAALVEREERLRSETGRAKDDEFFDYLRPAVLLSLNTGIRQNTLFSLVWGDVNLTERTLCLRGEISKNGKTARIPINDDAADILTAWHAQSSRTGGNDLIFPSPKTGNKLENARRSWEAVLRDAQIENFRWHDMRHDFASQLVKSGVDLTVVCELLNHSNLKLTMRYSHLSPESKLNAVQILNRRTKGDKIIGRIPKAAGDGE